MAPTQSTVAAEPTFVSSSTSPTHQISIPAIVALALFLLMMAALAASVILHQRREMASFKRKDKIMKENPPSPRANWSCVSRFNPSPRSIAVNKDAPTAVGALHAASALLAAAPCQVFSSPMTMHFRIPLEDKTILILGTPWFPVRCRAQCCGVPASGYTGRESTCDHTP